MKVKVEPTGLLHLERLGKDGVVEVPESSTVTDLLTALRVQPDHHRFVTAFINGEEKSRKTLLHEGDSVTLLLPVGGG